MTRLIQLAQHLVGRTNLDELFARLDGASGAVILMYHSISATAKEAAWVAPEVRWPVEQFQRQVDFLKRRRRVVPMSALIDDLAAGRTPARGTVAITFDDGYLDTLHVAAPILGAADLPATLYLPTWYIDHAHPQWVDELWSMIRARSSNTLATEHATLDLAGDAQIACARRALGGRLLEADLPLRQRLLEEARASLRPRESAPRLTMNWDEVRELASRFPRFELGAHTVTHLDLRSHTGDIAQREIAGSADAIERHTGARPRHFSFPYARWCPDTRAMVERAGFASAVGAGRGLLLGAASDRMALPRIEAHAGVARLKFLTSGSYPRLPLVSRA